MRGQATIALIVALDIIALAIMGFGTYSVPPFNNGTAAPTPPAAAPYCFSGYTKYFTVNMSDGSVRGNEVLWVNLTAVGVTPTGKGEEIYCVNATGSPLGYQTAINGIWWDQGGLTNVSATTQNDNYTFILINDTGGLATDKTIYCGYANTTEQTDGSVSIALWLDNFETTAVGTFPARAAATVAASLGGVCVSNGQHAAACGITGGQYAYWNVTQYTDITVIWNVNDSRSQPNDQQFAVFGRTSTYRMPYVAAGANTWLINFNGGATIGNTISYTGALGRPVNLTSRRTGNIIEIAINATLWGGNASDTTRTTHSEIAYVEAVNLKALLDMQVYNRSIQPYAVGNNVSYGTGSC